MAPAQEVAPLPGDQESHQAGEVPVADADAGVPPPSASRAIEEIVVTAQKREENLKDVPISVSAFSGGKLEALGVNNQQDLQLVTPGMSYTTPVGYSIIYIRGIGTDAFIPSADSSVATYIDGVYFPFAHGLAASFIKLDRIEVLKGPQGTLFGRNSTGGAINIITKTPKDDFETSLDVSYGSFNDKTIKGYLSAPLIGGLSGSLAVLFHDADGYMKPASTSPIQSTPTLLERGLNPRLQWKIDDDLTVMLSGFFLKSNGTNTLNGATQGIKPLGYAVHDTPGEPQHFNQNDPGNLNTSDKVGYSSLEWRPAPLDIKLLASYQDVRAQTSYDFDGGPDDIAVFLVPGEFSRTITGEMQLISKPGGFATFDNTLQWTAGYYYYYDIGGYDPAPLILGDPNAPSSALNIAPFLGDALTALTKLGLPIPNQVQVNLRGIVQTTANALYAQTTWRPRDWVGLTLGGRYQIEGRGTTKATSAIARPTAPEIPLFNFPLAETTTYNFSPKATLDFKPFGDEAMFYGSWQKGYKSGTYNVVAIYTKPDYVKPEKVRNVEAGIKGYLLNRSLSYNLAAFQSKVQNVQTLIISLTSGGAVHLVNAAQETIKGADFDILWEVLPETLPGFVMTANGAYLHGVYDSFPDGPGFGAFVPADGLFFGPGALIPSPTHDFSGHTTVKTPKLSGTLGLSETFDAPGGNVELGVNASYNSGFFYDTQNIVKQPAYTVLDARASYLYQPWNLRLSAWGKNLTSKNYTNGAIIDDFASIMTYGPPRMLGLSLGWEFRD